MLVLHLLFQDVQHQISPAVFHLLRNQSILLKSHLFPQIKFPTTGFGTISMEPTSLQTFVINTFLNIVVLAGLTLQLLHSVIESRLQEMQLGLISTLPPKSLLIVNLIPLDVMEVMLLKLTSSLPLMK